MALQPLRNDPPPTVLSARPVLGESGVAGVADHLGLACFEWDLGTDRMVWSANAASVLRLDVDALPANGRALNRLITTDTIAARTAATGRVGHVGSRSPERYHVNYAIRTGVEGDPVLVIEEHGRWDFDAAGEAVRVEGYLRALLPGCPEEGDPVNQATGLLQRDSLLKTLSAVMEGLKRDRNGSIAFMVIVIDDLATINSNFGYEIGDHIIATVAQRIARRMRQGDVLGHISGHKFGAILHNCTESLVAFVADRFRRAIADELIVTSAAQVQARISLGAVIVPRHAADAETAALRAEEALSDSRAAGNDSLLIYQPSAERDQIRRRNLQTAEEIVRGLAEDRFVLAYQPVVDPASGRIRYYEALSRLVRSDGVVASAGALIATAERLGLVRRIDLRTLALALADLHRCPDLRLSINASVDSLSDSVWLNGLVDALAADRTIAGRLTIEITETSAMRDVAYMASIAHTLRDIGCKVAFDDFGAGHTSFKALRQLPVDVVKIDGSYVRDLATDPDSAVFVGLVVDVARHFGIRTVAEFVQDAVAAEKLKALKVDGLQGRFTGEPQLRLTDETRALLTAEPLSAAEDPDGYRSFAGIMETPAPCSG